jgi:putative aldouronate transport system substrate-binding protein
MLGGMLAGCGKEDSETEAGAGASAPPSPSVAASKEPAGPLKLNFTIPLYDAQPPKVKDNPYFDNYQKITNTEINTTYVPNANYTDKLNLSIAGGELTDIMMVPAQFIKSTTFINAARGGMFWDLTEELKKYPNIVKNMPQITMTNTSVDGKTYGVPIPRATARVGLLYRKDWFDKLSIKVPTTMEEFYAAAKEIKAKMPEVTPFSYCDQISETPWNGLDFLTVSQGGYNIWGLKNGKLEPYYETAEYMNTLKTFKTMYSEGLLNKDFAIVQGAQKKNAISTGKAAMYITAYDDLVGIKNSLLKIDPNADLDLQPVFNGKTNATSGHNGLYVLPKSVVKTEEKRDAILSYFSRALDLDVIIARGFGIEGVSFDIIDGTPKVRVDMQEEFTAGNKATGNLYISPIVTRWPSDKPESTKIKDANEKYASSAVPNLIDPFVSATIVEKGGDLDKIVYDARVKYIMGELDEKGYAAAIAGWRAQGGDKITAEFTDAYNKANAK